VTGAGFDLSGAWTLSTGMGGRKSLEVLEVEVKAIFSVFWPYFYLQNA